MQFLCSEVPPLAPQYVLSTRHTILPLLTFVGPGRCGSLGSLPLAIIVHQELACPLPVVRGSGDRRRHVAWRPQTTSSSSATLPPPPINRLQPDAPAFSRHYTSLILLMDMPTRRRCVDRRCPFVPLARPVGGGSGVSAPVERQPAARANPEGSEQQRPAPILHAMLCLERATFATSCLPSAWVALLTPQPSYQSRLR